jgi:pyrroloquinoline quinone biosynthesis protein B
MSKQIEVMLLGSAQDGGVPQAGCRCASCALARRDPAQRRLVSSLGLIDRRARASWIVDATPDFSRQLDLLAARAPGCPLAGIILTHAHIGHYTGLIHLGREVMGTAGMPLYVTAPMAAFLTANGPWSQLVTLGNVTLHPIVPGQPFNLSPDLAITPLAVPHRAEFSDTLAVLAHSQRRRIFYCPDIDRWEQLDKPLPAFLAGVDVALLDGTFYSADELPGRSMAEIPHPLVTETAALLAGSGVSAGFIHLNHSNPLLHEGPELAALTAQGHWVGREGMAWPL